jgi:hypothetical protein
MCVGATGSTDTSAIADPKRPIFVVLTNFSNVEAAVAVNGTVSSVYFMSESVLPSFLIFQVKCASVLMTFTTIVLCFGPRVGLPDK